MKNLKDQITWDNLKDLTYDSDSVGYTFEIDGKEYKSVQSYIVDLEWMVKILKEKSINAVKEIEQHIYIYYEDEIDEGVFDSLREDVIEDIKEQIAWDEA